MPLDYAAAEAMAREQVGAWQAEGLTPADAMTALEAVPFAATWAIVEVTALYKLMESKPPDLSEYRRLREKAGERLKAAVRAIKPKR